MTDIQAALGLAQLERLDTIIGRRRFIAAKYTRAFKTLDLNLPPQNSGHIFFRYVLGFNTDCLSVIQALANRGIGCDLPVYLPLHRQLKRKGCPVSEKAWKNSLSIPIYPSLTDEEGTRVIDAVLDCVTQNR